MQKQKKKKRRKKKGGWDGIGAGFTYTKEIGVMVVLPAGTQYQDDGAFACWAWLNGTAANAGAHPGNL